MEKLNGTNPKGIVFYKDECYTPWLTNEQMLQAFKDAIPKTSKLDFKIPIIYGTSGE